MRISTKKYALGLIIISLLFITILYFANKRQIVFNYQGLKYENRLITDVYTDLARYNPGDKAKITIHLSNPLSESLNSDLFIRLMYLNETIEIINKKVTIEANNESIIKQEIELPKDDFRGYLVEVWLLQDSELYDMESTAIDVSSSWTKFPRYGYLSVFNNKTEEEIDNIINRLNKFHINGMQFYDWHFKHHQPVSFDINGDVTNQWNEIANRPVEKKVVDQYIDKGHEKNIAAMNYNLLFGAWEDYKEDGVNHEWGVYKDTNGQIQDYHPLPSDWASTKIYLFDPLNVKWQNYIISKEKEVFDNFNFDGWHIDQLGDRGRLFDYEGNKINLGEGYASLIKKAKQQLNKDLVFNAVNGYGQSLVGLDRQVDFLYTEVWNTDNYAYLKNYIDEGYRYTDNEINMVLAAYMNYGVKSGEFNRSAVLLTDAVIFASGGGHIELGDTGMLSSEYFPNDKLKVSEDLSRDLREYYDFITAYENLLRDNCEPIKPTVKSEKAELSKSPRKNKVWYFAKEKDNREVLQLINFMGISSMNWRDDTGTKEDPIKQENIDIKYYIKEDVKDVFITSPDYNKSHMTKLEFISGSDENGDFITFTVPQLLYWDMVIIEK